jgi:hypothetical protein
VGTYTYSNGATEPALKATDGAYRGTGHPWAFGPEVPKVTGLEVMIELDAESPEMGQYLGNQYWLRRRAKVTLKQHTITSTVRTASRALIAALNDARFTGLEIGPRVSRDTRIDNIETQSFTFLYSED